MTHSTPHPASNAPRTLVLGVGNLLMGDDAVGIRAIEALRAVPDLPPTVDLVDGGTDGLGLIPVLEQYRRAIIIDAVPMGAAPGTVRRFTWQDVRLQGQDRALSLHQSDLTDALLLAETLECLPADLVIIGVQPQRAEWDTPLSPAVAAALPALVRAVIVELSASDPAGGT